MLERSLRERGRRWTTPPLVALVAGLLTLIPQRAVSQAYPTTLLSRAVQAFEGSELDSGYVVLKAQFPHTVIAVVAGEDAALEIVGSKPDGTLTHSPLLFNDRELLGLSTEPMAVIYPCPHTVVSEFLCPGDPMLGAGAEAVPGIPWPVDSLGVIWKMNDGTSGQTIWGARHGIDAVVLTPRAAGKFYLPYLHETLPPEQAMRKYAEIIDYIRGGPPAGN